MLSVLGFLVILGPLVIVHEFGHFFFAKLFGVKAEVFSIGFGPKLWAKKFGETEFRLAAIPLGGFVKLLGEDPENELKPEEKARSLHAQLPWKRFFIFFGGPLFNFIWAAIVFMAILAIGEPQVANVVGRVVPQSEAEKAGFQSGDRILEVAGKPVTKFSEIMIQVSESPNEELPFKIQRASETLTLTHKITTEPGYSQYGEEKDVGKIDGLFPFARAMTVGISNPQSQAAKAGIKSGDMITEFNGKPIQDWEHFQSQISALPAGSEFTLKMKGEKDKISDVTFKKPAKEFKGLGPEFGLYSSELFVEKAMPDSPASKAGIKQGDRVVKIDTVELESFYGLKDQIQVSAKDDGKVAVTWEREGNLTSATLEPNVTNERDPVLRKVTNYTIGLIPMLTLAEPESVIERTLNPFMLVYKGTARMVDFSWKNVVAIGKMFTGDVSLKTLGGPILIGKLAGESIERGLVAFLNTMAVLSVGLGILNILPIPVLDGGHLLLLGIEAIRRKPLSVRQMEIAQQFGLSLILLLMVIVFKNDLARVLPIFN